MSSDWIPTGSVRAIPAKDMGNRGLFPSKKVSGGIVEYESCLERDFFLECEHAPDVMKFQHQPVAIYYKDGDGRSKKYTPDVFVEFQNGTRGLFEIKYEEEVVANGDKFQERWKEARTWAKEKRMEFQVLTEEKIRTPRWFNIWFTLGSSKCASNNRVIPDLIELIPNTGIRYNDLCQAFAELQGMEITKSAQVLCYAIYHGLVFVDTFSTKQISEDTIIRKKQQNTNVPFRPLWEEIEGESPTVLEEESYPPENDDTIETPTTDDLISFKIPSKYEEKVNVRFQIVKAWQDRPSKQRSPEWRAEFCKKWQVSEKTIYNWVGSYEKNGIEGLFPNHNRSGKRHKYGDALLQLMAQARQYFLAPLVTLNNAFDMLERSCKEHAYSPPPAATFKTYIYKNTTASEFARKRGQTYLKSFYTPSLASFQGAIAPMQVIQMDNTRLDVFPVDSEVRENLPTPYMTAAIDCYTRMLTGFSASYYPSSSQNSLEILVQSILPKQKYPKTYSTQQDWPIQGFPVILLVDNGMDYRSQTFKDFCVRYNIIVEYAPIRTPRFKAFIEQWFNLLHNALTADGVPGTRPSLKDRLENPDLNPESGAILTLQEIQSWLHRWVLDEYHFTNAYDDHAPAPFLRWQDFRAGHTGAILPSPREPPADKREVDLLSLSTLERIERELGPEGVVWEHLKYNNKELASVFKNSGRQKVEILLNRRDVRCVWVVHPITTNPIRVGLASGWAQAIANLHGNLPIDASAWATEVSFVKKLYGRRISPYDYQKEVSRIQRQELIQGAKRATKSARKAQEKVKESRQKELQAGYGELAGSKQSVTDIVDSPENKQAGNLPLAPKEIDWARIKPAGKRKRKDM